MPPEVTETFTSLAASDNQLIALLSVMVIALAGVVSFQWYHTAKNTVPLAIWERLVNKIDSILELQKTTTTIIQERLNRKQ
jgi:hypothetical protein